MHRSGTSCLTGIMQRMGIELGEVFTENEHNKKGNRENALINQLNDALLHENGGAWNDPVAVTKWHGGHTDARDALVAEMSAGGRNWGFKDPRSMFALQFWQEAIPEMRFIGTFRHPYRVAKSLNSRDNTPIEDGMELWRRYNVRMLEMLDQYGFGLVNFDDEPQAYLDDVIMKLVALGIAPDKAEEARDFFDTGLRNQSALTTDTIELPADVLEVYTALQAYHSSH